MFLNGPMFGLMTVLAATTGLVMFAFYAGEDCDPLSTGLVSNPNQVTIYIKRDYNKMSYF